MSGIPYPEKNCTIVFRQEFPRLEYSPERKYYIKAIVNGGPEREIRIDAVQQLAVMDKLIREDKKLLNACVKVIDGQFYVVTRSPQKDFFEAIDLNTLPRKETI